MISGIEKVCELPRALKLAAVQAMEFALVVFVSVEPVLELAVLPLAAEQFAVEPSSVTVAPLPSKSVAAALILSFDYEALTTADPVPTSD